MLPTHTRRLPLVQTSDPQNAIFKDIRSKKKQSLRNCSFSISCIIQIGLLLMFIVWLCFNILYLRQTTPTASVMTAFDDHSKIAQSFQNINTTTDLQILKNLEKLRKEHSFIETSPYRMHGKLGLKDDKTAGWIPNTKKSGLAMPILLRRGGGFNLEMSDSLPLDRNVIDSRSKECKALQYDYSSLPSLSIIIVFFNEPFSTLFRSVHSVLNRTPPQLVKEIVLVDDGSDVDWIKKGGSGLMDNYVKLLPKTKLIRSPTRKGIVSARMLGIRASTAPIFVVLDSHVEVVTGWAEPLAERISKDKTRILMPQIDGLNPENFKEEIGGIGSTLGFLWKLIEHGFTPDSRSPKDRLNVGPTDFVSSPTMAGGLFAAHRDFFLNELEGYDEQFQYWGTENLELSFRLWMCGGRLEGAPCSRVYHIFRRGGSGYSSPFDAVTKNKMRLLTVWMDEYADLAWYDDTRCKRLGTSSNIMRVIGEPRVDFGEYKTLLDWRKKKGCKSFKWFLNEVNPEAEVRNVPDDVPYLGPLLNEGVQKCLDTLGNDYPGKKVGMGSCHGHRSQDWMYFVRSKHIMPVSNDESCLSSGEKPLPDTTDWCNFQTAHYMYNPTTKSLKFESNGLCLGTTQENEIHFIKCDVNDKFQRWIWRSYNPPKVFTPPPMPGLRGG